MDKKKIQRIARCIVLYGLSTMKSIWYATYNILLIIVYTILLTALLSYYIKEYSLIDLNIKNFIDLTYLLARNWQFFWLAFFGLKLYDELRYRL